MMFFLRRLQQNHRVILLSFQHCYRRSLSTQNEPLRILFCGSDEFSAHSLKALNDEVHKNPKLIQTVDVICKQGKPSGRGLKTIREVPIKRLAQDLNLHYHEISTFTGWEPPKKAGPFNLIIAVSFGLLVPRRLLNSCKYGGLNLHPSLLPDLAGPAPLHHTLLEGKTSSGVTLQTLHPKHFDQGIILDQNRYILPDNGECTVNQLRDFLAPRAAELLIDALRAGKHIRLSAGRSATDLSNTDVNHQSLIHARKIEPEDAQIDWQQWTSNKILRVQRVIGPVWNYFMPDNNSKAFRVQWHDLEYVDPSMPMENNMMMHEQESGVPFILSGSDGEIACLKTCDGKFLRPLTMTIEGRKKHEDAIHGIRYLRNLK